MGRNLDKLLLDGGGTRQTGDSYAVRKCGFTRKAGWQKKSVEFACCSTVFLDFFSVKLYFVNRQFHYYLFWHCLSFLRFLSLGAEN